MSCLPSTNTDWNPSPPRILQPHRERRDDGGVDAHGEDSATEDDRGHGSVVEKALPDEEDVEDEGVDGCGRKKADQTNSSARRVEEKRERK